MLYKHDTLPNNVDAILIATPKTETNQILISAIVRGIKNIWIQRHSNTKETMRIADDYGQEIIIKKCIMMFSHPVTSFHHFHRSLTGIFGQLPR